MQCRCKKHPTCPADTCQGAGHWSVCHAAGTAAVLVSLHLQARSSDHWQHLSLLLSSGPAGQHLVLRGHGQYTRCADSRPLRLQQLWLDQHARLDCCTGSISHLPDLYTKVPLWHGEGGGRRDITLQGMLDSLMTASPSSQPDADQPYTLSVSHTCVMTNSWDCLPGLPRLLVEEAGSDGQTYVVTSGSVTPSLSKTLLSLSQLLTQMPVSKTIASSGSHAV